MAINTTGDGAEIQGKASKVPALCSQRWNLAVLGFFGLLFVYVVRVNLSVAIICMVRAPRENISTHALLMDENLTAVTSAMAGVPTHAPNPDMGGGEDELEGTGWESCESLIDSVSGLSYAGEFDWDKTTRSRLLAMYFYGYIFTQIPGGWLAGRYGGRRVWGFCQTVSAICTLLTPLAARTNVYLAYALRFLLGLAAGVSFPCFHAMMGRWAPTFERSKLVAFGFAGPSVGTILTFALSALLCSYGFDNGWGSIFYLAGAGNLLWVLIWAWVTADTPSKHNRITAVERNYILTSIGERPDTKEKLATPWRAMFTSGPLWAIIAAHLCNNYTNYTLLTSLPTFMKEVLKFDIKQNGALSALPYICQAVISVLAGQLADFLRIRRILSTKNTRKLMQVTSFLGTAVCIACAGYMTCGQRPLAVVLLCFCLMCMGLNRAFLGMAALTATIGFLGCQQRYVSVAIFCTCLAFMGLGRASFCVNHVDLAPRHAGVLFGITNTAGTIPGMIAPLVAGALTPNKTAEEWQRVFFICSGLATLGALLFGVLADGELQPWAAPPQIEVPLKDASKNADKNDTTLVEEEAGEDVAP